MAGGCVQSEHAAPTSPRLTGSPNRASEAGNTRLAGCPRRRRADASVDAVTETSGRAVGGNSSGGEATVWKGAGAPK